ncbi:hypothetical protein PHYBOEH_008877 [Phytophthora boehmeriae]|uniref:PexRD2 WYL domain-containing protein n=1 Tax=Phytophthora boehmeriae TaxID=109152 RepID=A0A8T1VX22_9STRA|nr:hypothetical protein PHYBOEH_008877 [Phytophthora boehmeriae]
MRTCYLLLAVVTTALESTKATVFAVANSKEIKNAGAISSLDTAPSTPSLSVRDRSRALRGTGIDNLDSLDDLDLDGVEGEGAAKMSLQDDEERGLTPAKMKKMRKNGMTKEDYASKLGISDKIASVLAGGPGLNQFLQTHKYQKYKTYMNFLIDAKKKGK